MCLDPAMGLGEVQMHCSPFDSRSSYACAACTQVLKFLFSIMINQIEILLTLLLFYRWLYGYDNVTENNDVKNIRRKLDLIKSEEVMSIVMII